MDERGKNPPMQQSSRLSHPKTSKKKVYEPTLSESSISNNPSRRTLRLKQDNRHKHTLSHSKKPTPLSDITNRVLVSSSSYSHHHKEISTRAQNAKHSTPVLNEQRKASNLNLKPLAGHLNYISTPEASCESQTPILRDYSRLSRSNNSLNVSRISKTRSPLEKSESIILDTTKYPPHNHDLLPKNPGKNLVKKRRKQPNEEEIERWCHLKNSELEKIDSQELFIE
ncbi:unnamed protein product [Gordionus sp. m RMFG-2023]